LLIDTHRENKTFDPLSLSLFSELFFTALLLRKDLSLSLSLSLFEKRERGKAREKE